MFASVLRSVVSVSFVLLPVVRGAGRLSVSLLVVVCPVRLLRWGVGGSGFRTARLSVPSVSDKCLVTLRERIPNDKNADFWRMKLQISGEKIGIPHGERCPFRTKDSLTLIVPNARLNATRTAHASFHAATIASTVLVDPSTSTL